MNGKSAGMKQEPKTSGGECNTGQDASDLLKMQRRSLCEASPGAAIRNEVTRREVET